MPVEDGHESPESLRRFFGAPDQPSTVGLDGLWDGTVRAWPRSIRAHHHKTMAQRSKRTQFQRKDVDGVLVLRHILAASPVHLMRIEWPWPYVLVRMKVDQLERDGLVDNGFGFGNCPKITSYGIQVLRAWDAGEDPPAVKWTTEGTVGGLPRTTYPLHLGEGVMVGKQMHHALVNHFEREGQRTGHVVAVSPTVLDDWREIESILHEAAHLDALHRGPVIVTDRVERPQLLLVDPVFADLDGHPFGVVIDEVGDMPLKLPTPIVRKSHQSRQDRRKRSKFQHWMKQ